MTFCVEELHAGIFFREYGNVKTESGSYPERQSLAGGKNTESIE